MTNTVHRPAILPVQFLRFAAAFAVICAHSLTEMGYHRVGSFGVDIFFVITGFVILISTEGENGGDRFLQRRIARLVPLAWAGLAAYAAVKGFDSWHQLAAGLLFLTDWHPAGHVFSLYWTLTIEMGFALLFATAMAVSHARRAELASIGIIALVLMGANPILLEFIIGMIAGWLYLRGERIADPWFPALAIGAGMIGLQAVIDPLMEYRVLWFGLPAGVLILSIASMCDRPFARLAWLGDISYSLYVWHLFVIGAAASLIGHQLPVWAFLALVTTGSVAVSWVSYRLIEVPARRWISQIRILSPQPLARDYRLAMERNELR